MNINIGSQNKAKIASVKQAISKHPAFAHAQVHSMAVDTGVDSQPKTLKDIMQGAANRAKAAFKNCDLSIGLESGLFEAPFTKSGYFDTCGCAIFDGKEVHFGLSSCFEYPPEVTRLIFEEGIEATDAAIRAGLIEGNHVREQGGIVGKLTKGLVSREDYGEQAVHMALIHLENKELYEQ